MKFRRIQHRTILLFVLFALALLVISGWMLQWMIRQNLEAELGRKLTAVASIVAVQFSEEEITFLERGLGPRASDRLRQSLLDMLERTELQRIYFFDLGGHSLLDTENTVRGETHFNLRFFQREMDILRSGTTAHTILFEDIDGHPAMTGFAPLMVDGGVVGGVGVDGSVTFLGAVSQLRNRLLVVGLLGLLAAVLLGALLARTITRPVNTLVAASRKIGQGDYSEPIPTKSSDEIGTLAVTMEDMRTSVLERERELKAMLAGVAHEIRNPLGGIELFVGLLSDHVIENEEARKHVGRITGEIGQLKRIVDSFLEYARPRTPSLERCNLQNVLDETVSLVESDLMNGHLDLTLDRMDQAPPVMADPQHLKQVFLNLIHNAIQAQTDGGNIRIGWRESARTVTVSLSESGNGIPADARERIFEPFFTTREAGTGLGLAIVRNLVEAGGGSIHLARSDQQGTVFDILLKKSMRTDSPRTG